MVYLLANKPVIGHYVIIVKTSVFNRKNLTMHNNFKKSSFVGIEPEQQNF